MTRSDTYEALLAGGRHGLLKQAWRNFLKNRLAVFALLFLILIHVAGYLAPWIAPYPYERIDLTHTLAPPGAKHLLGTDESGRDVASRLIYGARISLSVGIVAMTISLTLGTLLGAVAGFVGKWVDSLIMRFTDAMLCIPLFFFMLTYLALMGSSMTNIVISIALSSWMPAARVVRGEVLSQKNLDFVTAARALGMPRWRILFSHVLPQSIPSIIVAGTLCVAYAILIESALSYLGLGVQPPVPSWGNMLSNGRGYLWSSPSLAFYPGVMIFMTVLAYNFMGDGFRDILDPSRSVKKGKDDAV